MATRQHSPLSVLELRALIRAAKTAFVPDYIAQNLRDRTSLASESEASELAGMLKDLIDAARTKLHNDGLEPLLKERAQFPRLPKKECERASNVACLLRFYSVALFYAGDLHAAEEAVREGIGWARTGMDLREESWDWRTLAQICQGAGRLAEEETVLQNSVNLARSVGDPILILKQMRELIAAYVAHDKLSLADPLIEEAFELAESISEEDRPLFVPQLHAQKGRIAMSRQNAREGIATFREALRLSDETIDPTGHMAILTQLGLAYLGLGDYQQSIDYQREMVQIAEKYNDRNACTWGLFRLGESYGDLGDMENAEKAFALAWERCPDASKLPRLHILAKRAQLCLNQGKIEEGIGYCHRILEMSPERESVMLTIFTLMHLGLLEERRGNLSDAEHHLRRAIDLGRGSETSDRSANVSVHLSKVLLGQGREEEAEELLTQICATTIRKVNDELAVTTAFQMLADLKERRGEFKEALAHAKEHKAHNMRMVARHTEEAVHKARVLAEVELYEREAQFERERRRQIEHELAEAIVSIDKKKLIIEKVEKQLHKTLSFLASEKANEVVGTLRDVLLGIDSKEGEKEHALHYIRSIDSEFSLRLRERWPGLTRKQERLCGLIRAGLTSQEIVNLLGITYETLRAQRKRLRKALELQSGETLETVIGEV